MVAALQIRAHPVNLLSQFLGWIFDADQNNTQQRDDSYIAGSADLYELEARMRELDRRRPFGPFGLNA
jgi:Protein of unknown function (DUF3563)